MWGHSCLGCGCGVSGVLVLVMDDMILDDMFMVGLFIEDSFDEGLLWLASMWS